MIAPAAYVSYKDTATTFMRPLLEASELLVANSRTRNLDRENCKPQDAGLADSESNKLAVIFANSIHALELAERSSLYCTQEELIVRLESLTIALNSAATVKNLTEALLKNNIMRLSRSDNEAIMMMRSQFFQFYDKLQEVVEFVTHLANTPEPDEDSSEFADFLIALNKAV